MPVAPFPEERRDLSVSAASLSFSLRRAFPDKGTLATPPTSFRATGLGPAVNATLES